MKGICVKNKIKEISNIFVYFNYILNRTQKVYGVFVLILSFIGALLETLGVSVIVPLVSVMTQPEELMHNKWIAEFMKIFEISTAGQLIIAVGIAIIIVYIFKNLYFIFLSWIRIKYACKIRRELSTKAMNAYMNKGYDYFLKVSTAEILRGIVTDTAGVYDILYQGFRFITETLTIMLISIYIFITDWKMALCVVVLAVLCIVIIFFFFRNRMRSSGVKFRDAGAENNKVLLQTFEGIKEVLVMHRQKYFLDEYKSSYLQFQNAMISQTVASESPAYVIEGICVSGLLGAVCVRAAFSSDMAAFLPALASFAVGAFRILPSLGRISTSLNLIMFTAPSLYSTYCNFKTLDEEARTEKDQTDTTNVDIKGMKKTFEEKLEMEDISWHYADTDKMVLDHLNMVINKGESIGIIGKSGAGKSTLIDIILGLHIPQQGHILMDGCDIQKSPAEWENIIGYVPQSVYLMDASIRSNVAFGIPREYIDDGKVWDALKRAQLSEFVEQLENGLDTVVGERGVRFSGGQKQRIAIARALYQAPQILLMDEATSALDNDTEKAFMESVESLQGKVTLIIVAHRLTTVHNCDRIYEIEDGRAVQKDKKQIFG